MNTEKKIAKRGFNPDGLKTSSTVVGKRVRRANKRSARAKAKALVNEDALYEAREMLAEQRAARRAWEE